MADRTYRAECGGCPSHAESSPLPTRAEARAELVAMGWEVTQIEKGRTRTLCPYCAVGWVLRRIPSGYHLYMKHGRRALALITGRRGSWAAFMFDESGKLEAKHLGRLRPTRNAIAADAWREARRRGVV